MQKRCRAHIECHLITDKVNNLANNHCVSDAHGKGKIAAKPQPRHAELAVTPPGALTLFVLSMWEARKDK